KLGAEQPVEGSVLLRRDLVAALVEALLEPANIGAAVPPLHHAGADLMLGRGGAVGRTAGRAAADLHVAGLDPTEHLGPMLGHGRPRLVRHRPGELDVQVTGVRVDAGVVAPAGVRVGRGPDAAVPDHALDPELLRHGHDGVRQSRAIGGTVGADTEVSRASLTVDGRRAAAAHRPAVVDTVGHGTLGLVGGQVVVHRAPGSRLWAGRAMSGALVCAGEDGHWSSSSSSSSASNASSTGISSSARVSSTGSAPSTCSKSSSTWSFGSASTSAMSPASS